MDATAGHDPTLMRRTLMEWVEADGAGEPAIVNLRCQQCGRVTDVDAGLFKRGEWFCDGGEILSYRKYTVERPGMTQVVYGEQAAVPDPDILRVYELLQHIREEITQVEALLYSIANQE